MSDREIKITEASNGYVVIASNDTVTQGHQTCTTVHNHIEEALEAVLAHFGYNPTHVQWLQLREFDHE